jgi:hypothetical protein
MAGQRFAAALSLLAAVAAGCGSGSSTANSGDAGNPAGCPPSVPSAGASCDSPGLHCTYGCGNVFATCSGGSWAVAESNIMCPREGGAPSDGGGACSSNADCTSAFSCSPGGVETGCGICAMPQNPCSTDSDCSVIGDAASSQPMVCGPGGACTCPVGGKTGSCIPACTTASGCGPDEACASSGHCVAKPCTSDAQCPSTQTVDYACSGGVCATKSCKTDADCGAHYCVNGTCYPQAGVCVPPAA